MRILVIAPQPFFTPRGTPFSVYYRSLVTSQLGNDIDLLTYGQGKDVAISGTKIIRIPSFSKLGNIKVGPSLFKLFLDGFLIVYTIGLLLSKKYDVVHAHEEAVFFCRFLKPIFNFKLIYDMHSSLPQQLTNFEFTKSKLLVKIFKWLEDSCLRHSEGIITICPDLADYVNKLLDKPAKHFLIENSIFEPIQLADTSQDKDGTPMQGEIQLPANGKYIVYAGTLEPYQGIDILLPAFRLFNEKTPGYKLVIVGGMPKQVQQYVAQAGENNITEQCVFTGQVRQALAKHYISQAAILVSPRKHGTNTPLKVYEQIASGIPLVATRIYSHTQILSDEVAVLVEPTPESLAQGLAEATGATGQKKALQAQLLYKLKYSKDIYVDKMKKLFSYVESSPRI